MSFLYMHCFEMNIFLMNDWNKNVENKQNIYIYKHYTVFKLISFTTIDTSNILVDRKNISIVSSRSSLCAKVPVCIYPEWKVIFFLINHKTNFNEVSVKVNYLVPVK